MLFVKNKGMRLTTKEEYDEIKPIIKNEMIALAKHENKNSYFTQMSINNCFVRSLSEGMQLYQIYSLGFIPIIERDYINALRMNPDLFGTGNAKDVIHALYIQAKNNNYVWSEENYIEFLSNEIFCLLLCKKDKVISNDILRIDLFRKLKESKTVLGSYDFVGGIFHALKHFSVDEQCASILPNQNVALFDIEQLIWPIAKAFFEGNWRNANRKNTYETETLYLGKKMTLEFYKEGDNHVSFVNSIIPKSI